MPTLAVVCGAPEGLVLPPGEYGETHRSLKVLTPLPRPSDQVREFSNRLSVSMAAKVDDGLNEVQQEKFKEKTAQQLLSHLNLLVRWYRAEMKVPTIHELTLAQASPFIFVRVDDAELWGTYAATALAFSSLSADSAGAVQRVREGYDKSLEPPVEVLLLMDARQAVIEGRFREAVLFCWSVIDSVFNQRFEALVKIKLDDEWKESREFLIGNDFGLRHKMSIGMRLVTGRTLAKEADDFWSKLDQSYKKRNLIIHEGDIAAEVDAKLAIWVAERLVAVMESFRFGS